MVQLRASEVFSQAGTLQVLESLLESSLMGLVEKHLNEEKFMSPLRAVAKLNCS
jgi:hypothetical protein